MLDFCDEVNSKLPLKDRAKKDIGKDVRVLATIEEKVNKL